jgi:SAM-dependent methyltransferase
MTMNAQSTMKAATATTGLSREPITRDGTSVTGTTVCPLCGSRTTREFLRAPDRFHLRREIYQLMLCADCMYVWLASPPAPEEMGLHYGEDYHCAIAAAGETGVQGRWQRHGDLISRHTQGGAILDIGCSSGAFLGTMKRDCWKLYGIEMEQETAEKARSATGAQIFVGDAMDAPFASESFDAITCFDVLEHVYNPRAFLSQVREWLKPGGKFFVMLPNIESWEARAFGSYWYGLELPRHLSHFSPRSLRYLMGSLGFREVHLKTPRISYVERSVGYLCSAGLGRLGVETPPQSRPRRAGIPKRAVRKALRVALIEPFAAAASVAGAGGSIEAVFGKLPVES